MFNVNNSKSISLLSRRSLRRNRTRNIVAVIAIILTSVLFATVFTVGLSVIESFQLSTMRQVGTKAHGGFKYLTQEQYEKVCADPKVRDISYNILIGFAENEALNKTYTEIRYTEEKAAEWSFAMPTTGGLPKERLDVATSTAVLDALGVPHEIGAEVPLEFTANGVKYSENFKLCGFWEQDAVSAANEAFLSREYADEVAPVWTEVPERFGESSYDSGSIHPSIWFASSWNLEGQMQELKERCGFGDDVNDGVNWAYMSSTVDATTILLIAGLLILIMLSGYLIIYNVFYISVSNEIKFYGLLKTIGTTNKQLKKIVRRQAALLSLLGVPAGLLLGYLLSVFIIPVVSGTLSIGSDYEISVNPLIFIGGAAFSLITVWISCIKPCRFVCSISPVEAVRYTDNASQTRKKRKKTRRVTPVSMAVGNIGRTKKKTAAVVISLSLSLILLNGTVTLVNGFDMDKYIENSVVSDFYVTDASITNLSSAAEIYDGVSADLRGRISELEGITEMGSVYMKESLHKLSGEKLENGKRLLESYRDIIFPQPEYAAEVDRLLGEEGSMRSHLYGVDEFVAEKMEIFDGRIDMEKFKTGDYVVVTTVSTEGDGHFYEVGDTVEIDFGNGNKKEYEVMALGNIPYALSPQHSHAFDIYFTTYSDEFIAQTGDAGAMKTAFNVLPENYDGAEEWLENYCENVDPNIDYRSRNTYVAEFESMRNMYLFVGGALSFILALIGILNFVNAVVTSIQTRRLELAVLQSIGMTGKQLKRMLVFEGVLYILLTAAFSLSLGSLAVYAIVSGVANQIWFFTYRFTIAPMLLCIPAFLAVSVAAPILCYKNMRKRSIVDRLRVSD